MKNLLKECTKFLLFGSLLIFLVLPINLLGNELPVITANIEHMYVGPGQTASTFGTVSDSDGDPVILSSNIGTVVDNSDGTWSWSYNVPVGEPPQIINVIIYADDGTGVAFLWLPPLKIIVIPTETEILDRIVLGLSWLVSEQLSDGSWNGGYPIINIDEPVACTGFVLTKLCDYAYESGYESPFDPNYIYSQNVINGYNYLFQHANTTGSDNGIFICFGSAYSHHENYNTAVALMAIAATKTPNKIITVGNTVVDGKTYLQVADEVVEYFEVGQGDIDITHPAFGGWAYHQPQPGFENDWSDNSNSGYVVLGLRYAEAFGCLIPQIIKDRLNVYIDYIQNDISGGSGYTQPDIDNYGLGTNALKTGNLLFEMAFVGDNINTARVQNAISYIQNVWDQPFDGWKDNKIQSMYCLMKGFESLSIDYISVEGNQVNWFEEFSTELLYFSFQDFNEGYWGFSWYGDRLLNTCWALYILEKVVPPSPTTFVNLDIHPTSWPNPINPKNGGVIPVAILGTADLDVTLINPASILLEGVPPLRWAYEDVTQPSGTECECNDTELGADGYVDLTLKFDNKEFFNSFGPVNGGDIFTLVLTGEFMDGSNFEGDDCVLIPNKDKLNKETPMIVSLDNPKEFKLVQNYPNPFNPTTTIGYQLPYDTHVSLKIYNIIGNEIATLVNEQQTTGYYSVEFNAENQATGIYYFKLKTNSNTETKKMFLCK